MLPSLDVRAFLWIPPPSWCILFLLSSFVMLCYVAFFSLRCLSWSFSLSSLYFFFHIITMKHTYYEFKIFTMRWMKITHRNFATRCQNLSKSVVSFCPPSTFLLVRNIIEYGMWIHLHLPLLSFHSQFRKKAQWWCIPINIRSDSWRNKITLELIMLPSLDVWAL